MPDRTIEHGLELLRAGQCKEVTEAALIAHCARTTLGEYWRAEQVGEPAGRTVDEAAGTMRTVTNPGELPAKWTPENLADYYGVDLERWAPLRIRGNLWGDPADPRNQLRIDWVIRTLLLEPPDPGDWTPPPMPKVRKRAADEPRKVVICGDHHCPHEDRELHSAFLQLLEDERPDEGVILGDLLDFSSISRHRRGKKLTAADVNPGLRAALSVLQDYRAASPNTFWTLLPGNHDDRLDHIQIDNAAGIYEVKPGGGVDLEGKPTNDALSLRELLFLDLLGMELIEDDFNRAKHLLGRKITLRHGYLSGKNASANMLNKIARSTVQGHTHRLRMIYKTEHDEHDEEQPTTTRLGAEAGCMATIRDGLGYDDQPDWQQGAMLAHLWPDNDFTLAPIVYAPGRLLSPTGKRYVPA